MYDFTPSKNFVDRIIVHGGVFHADDVLCVAVAKAINPDVEIQRVFRVPDEAELPEGTIVADIGRGTYDHHQPDSKTDPIDGHKYAAIGLILNDERIFDRLTESLEAKGQNLSEFREEIRKIEDLDNGIKSEYTTPVTYLCQNLNPTWDEQHDTSDRRFEEAVSLVKENFLEPFIKGKDMEMYYNTMYEIGDQYHKDYERSEEHAREIVEPALEKMENKVVTLPQYAPWEKVLVPSAAEFVIYPSNRGGFNLQCVPPELDSFEKKVELPDWSDKMPEGCTFEHPQKFLAAFDTLEHAQAAAEEIKKTKLREGIEKDKEILHREIDSISAKILKSPEDFFREFDHINELERDQHDLIEAMTDYYDFKFDEKACQEKELEDSYLAELYEKKNEVALSFMKTMNENKEFRIELDNLYGDNEFGYITYKEENAAYYDKIIMDFPEKLREDLMLGSDAFTFLPPVISNLEKEAGTNELGEFIKNHINWTCADYEEFEYRDEETGEWIDEFEYREQYPGSPVDLDMRFMNNDADRSPNALPAYADTYKQHLDWTLELTKHYNELVPETAKEVFYEGFSKALGIEESSFTVDDPRVENAMNNLLSAPLVEFSSLDEGIATYKDVTYININSIRSFEDFVEQLETPFEYEYDPIETAREEYEEQEFERRLAEEEQRLAKQEPDFDLNEQLELGRINSEEYNSHLEEPQRKVVSEYNGGEI